nr:hypothetical protein [Tanacetum cinerariifolium]
ICPRLPGQSFVEPPFEEEILTFLCFLRYSGAIRKLTDVKINKLHQPWRSFAAIINKCLTRKSSGYDSLRLSQAQIMWGYTTRGMLTLLIWCGKTLSNKLNIKIRRRAMKCIILGIITCSPRSSWYPDIRTRNSWKTRSSSDTTTPPLTADAGPRLTISKKGKQAAKASKAKSLSALSKVAITEAQQLKLATKRSLHQTHISQASGSGADEGTGTLPGVPDVPTDESEEEIFWKSTDEEGDDDDDQEDEGNDENDQEEGSDDEKTSNEEEFIYPSLSTHAKEEPRDEESFDPILKTPKNTNDEGNGMESIFETTSQMDVQTPTSLATLPMSAPTLTPSTIATITTTIQAPTPPTTALSTLLQDLPNFGLLFGFNNRLKTLEANFYEFMQTNQFAGAVSSIPGIVQRYMDQRMNEAVKVAVQIQSDQIRDEAQAENNEFLKTIDENMQKIIKEQVKEQVKVQVSKILPKIEQIVNEQLKAEVLTRSSNSSKTSYVVAADLFEMDLKKILIEKIEGNKSIHRDTITLKRRHDDDVDKYEEPSAGSDRGSKRRREGKEPESASAPKEKATMSAGKSTQGSKSRQTSASESATAKEPMQTTFEMEELSHPEFETGVNDQPIVQPSQHLEWFSQQKKPPTPDRDWNKTLPATHGSIQPWISELAKQSDSRSTFNELMDTPVDFSNFLMNRLKVDTLILKLLADPTYELMKGSCKSLVEIEFFLEEFYKATTDQLDWVNPEGQQYPHNLLKPLPLIPDSRGHRVIPFDHFINKDLEYLRGGKLTNLTVEERFAFNVSLRMFIRSIIIQRHVEDLQLGVESYQKKLNLTRPNTDGTLTDVHTALDDRLKGIRMKYLPKSIWRKSDKDRAAAMIQAIDKMLKTRRIMRNLERLVGGRLYEGDFRMLQRTI